MKKTRRIAAMIAAMALAATMVAPTMMNASANNNNTITITNFDNATHTYEAYQIFSATYNSDGSLTAINWGDGINSSTLLTNLIAANTANGNPLNGLFTGITSSSTAQDVADCLGAKTTSGDTETAVFVDDSDKAQAFAAIVGESLSSTKSGTASGNTISGLPDGYYLVQDSAAPSSGTDGNSGAKTRYIIDVVGNTTVSVNAKQAISKVS